MKTKKVNRYWCDYCGKQGGSAGHMKHHEERCTKNLNRVCGMCKIIEQDQPKLSDMLAILPDPKSFKEMWGDEGQFETLNDTRLLAILTEVFPKLRDIAGECPACIMAALRQKGIPVPLARSLFDYTKECQSFWSDLNGREYESAERSACYY